MRAPISVIVPTLNGSARLPDCLAALIEGLRAGLIRELIVSDGGSSDDSRDIALAAGALVVNGPASRGGQLRRGVAAAQGDWLLVLHADCILAPGWTDAVARHVEGGQGAAWFRLAFRATGMLPAMVAAWANLRARFFALPYGDQGLLVRRADYDHAGGYPNHRLMEDVALARALGRPMVGLPVTITTSAARYRRNGWLGQGARNLWTLARYLGGADPDVLAARYHKR